LDLFPQQNIIYCESFSYYSFLLIFDISLLVFSVRKNICSCQGAECFRFS